MAYRSDARPVIINGDFVTELERMSVEKNELGECKDLRDSVIDHPVCLPISQIDPHYSPLISLGTEVETGAGPIDCLFIAPNGLLTIVETKLWRNPEARREVVGQILDYAKEVARWTYADLDKVSRIKRQSPLWELVQAEAKANAIGEQEFVDRTSKYLREGRFLLLIVGDGIREDVEAMATYLQAAPQLLFTLHLVELQFFKTPDGSRLVVPQLLARTKEVVRAVMHVRVAEGLNVSVDVEVPSEDGLLPKKGERNRLSEAEFLTSFEETQPHYVRFMQKLIEDVATDSDLTLDWHANSLSIKARDPSNPRILFSLLNVGVSGKVVVWSLRDQFIRSGLPPELAEAYLASVGAALGTQVVNYLLRPPGSVAMLQANYEQVRTSISALIAQVRESRRLH